MALDNYFGNECLTNVIKEEEEEIMITEKKYVKNRNFS